jgi:hypothetical protein
VATQPAFGLMKKKSRSSLWFFAKFAHQEFCRKECRIQPNCCYQALAQACAVYSPILPGNKSVGRVNECNRDISAVKESSQSNASGSSVDYLPLLPSKNLAIIA